jgi:hypothetical protein
MSSVRTHKRRCKQWQYLRERYQKREETKEDRQT